MITYLFNKLPAVRRLRSELSAANAKLTVKDTQLAHERGQHNGTLHREVELKESLDHTKQKRSELQRQFDDLRELTIKQTATIDVLRGHRETDLRLLNEGVLAKAEARSREERFMHTIDTLNATLQQRDRELDDTREELASAAKEMERLKPRPAMFVREGGMPETEIELILAGQAENNVVKAMFQLLDERAVMCMSESATPPAITITDGPYAARGYSTEERTFSSGGTFALARLKEDLQAAVADRREEKKAA